MNKKLVTISVSALAISMVLAGSVYAYQGNSNVKGPSYTPEREAQITQAMEKGDYESWKTFMNSRGNVTKVVTKDNFAKFAEAWKLSKEGKVAEADAIRKELGLRTSDGTRSGLRKGKMEKNSNNQRSGFVDQNKDGICDLLAS